MYNPKKYNPGQPSPEKARPEWLLWPVWLDIPVMALFGLLAALSAPGVLPGLDSWPIVWVAWIFPLFWATRQTSWRRIFGAGFWMGVFYGGLYCFWFLDLHPLAWMGFDAWESRGITIAGWLLLAAENGLLVACLLTAFRWLPNGWFRFFLFPLVWVGLFSLMNLTPLALPWALPEYTQTRLPLARAVMSVIGGSGLSALIAGHNALWANGLSFYGQWKPASRKTGGRNRRFLLLLPVAIFVAALSSISKLKPAVFHPPWPMPVAVVQANLPIEMIRSGQLSLTQIQKTYLAPVERTPLPANTLILYPEEGVVSGWVKAQDPLSNPGVRQLVQLAARKRSFIAVGVSLLDRGPTAVSNLQLYNALVLISPDSGLPKGQPVLFYRKRRLVPFGEYTPYGLGPGLTNLLSAFNVSYSADFAIGPASPAVLSAGDVRLGPLICFELIDALPMAQGFGWAYQAQGTDLLVNASNLGWFHQSPLLEAQFLAIGQARAAETGLPLIIAGNTGPSAILDGTGNVLLRTSPASFFQHKTQILFYNGRQGGTFSYPWGQ